MQRLPHLHAVAIASVLAIASLGFLVGRAKPARALGAATAKAAAPTAKGHAAAPAALEKTVLGVDVPTERNEFSVSADGKRTYFASGGAYYVFDERGDLVNRMSITSIVARTVIPLSDGRFISAQSHGGGHIALLGPDGKELRALVKRGPAPENLHPDKTSWASPTGIAFDAVHQLLFALDTTAARAGIPDPDWSRIAVFDAAGKYLREIALYDGSKNPATDEHRTWYDDIEVDAKRSAVYVTARAAHQLWAFGYDGKLIAQAPGVRGIAVLPNGNVAVGDPDNQHIRIYDPALNVLKTLAAPSALDLEADAAGRLYASSADPTVLYRRWPATLAEPEVVHPNFRHISVSIPFDRVAPGAPLSLHVAVTGRPEPTADSWHVFARPSDGSDLSWRELDATYAAGVLNVRPPPALLGSNDIAVRYGRGAISRADGTRDLHVTKTIRFTEASENGSIGIRPVSGRSAFQRGEAIAIRISTRGATPIDSATLTLQHDGELLANTKISLATNFWELPAAFTRHLLSGHYALTVAVDSLVANTYEFDIAEAEPTSPMQRILYHEFEANPASSPQSNLLDIPERLAFVRDYVESVANLGFTRETDRSAGKLMNVKSAGAWSMDSKTEQAAHDLVPESGRWEPEFYLDRATAAGIHFDTQLLSHCSGVRLADSWFPPLNATLQRLTQWFGKYPSFYGFNYNDEIFFPTLPFVDSVPGDKVWLDTAAAQLVGRPKPDVFRAGLTHMYGEFDRAVSEVRPDLSRTTTPMWQYPAVEGSYAPTIYEHMTESYSHYLSEGYGWPWYPAHSAEILRRPGLPLMAVFDNEYSTGDGESYLKDALQVLGRGVQGFGVEHERPLKEAHGSNALRLMNALGETYGPIFAETPPDNEAVVLYSYTQDISEKRHTLGTPHWERVQTLYGAGLMSGLPMSIAYEEDIAAGSLLENGKPKANLLFLVGQSAQLPTKVKTALSAFTAAGGRIVIDADSKDFQGAIRFPQSLLGPSDAALSGFDGDGALPDAQPAFEAVAAALSKQFGQGRRFPVDTDDPWVSKNRFNAGAIRYVLIASETSPYPWEAASVWSLGGRFSKSYWPKRVALTVPRTPAIYDVFERQLVATAGDAKSSKIQADLTTFPGKLYALAPRALDAPELNARLSKEDVTYTVNVGLPARVPLRIVLSDGHTVVSTAFRATDSRGEFAHRMARPAGPGPWRLEVSELLGGKSSSLTIPAAALPQPWILPLADVETEREAQIRELLSKARGNLKVAGSLDGLPTELRVSLQQTLKTAGLNVMFETAPSAPGPGTYLVLETMSGKGPSELLNAANQAGLFGRKLSDVYPGPGRGFLSAAFAPRLYGEDCITIIGGDQRGLKAATERFIALVKKEIPKAAPNSENRRAPPLATLTGARGPRVDMPTLNERVGVRLSGIRASHGKVALTAAGYLANLAQVDDDGDHGRLVAALRVGESPLTTSLFVSNDGKSYGVAARTLRRFGEAFSLSSVNSATPDLFTSFGDAAPFQHVFSASGDANTVLAPGPFGIVTWQRKANGWREAWSVDYWKNFDSLDWPVTAKSTRIPSFDTLVPRNGDVGLIAFGELTNNNWLASGAISSAEVTARSLRDGSVRWHFGVPVTGAIVFPKLYSNSDGSLVVVQAQLGNSGPLRYYAIEKGKLSANWGSDDAPLSVDISDNTGRIVSAYGNGSRLLEVRMADGTTAFSKTWHSQPTAVLFAEDGASLFVSDDAGVLSRLDPKGELVWRAHLGCSAELARDDARLYAAGWDGRLRALTSDGHERWNLDLTGPMARVAVDGRSAAPAVVYEAVRPANASPLVPKGVNLLSLGQATLSVGGTPGWKSAGKVQIEASELTNGVLDDAVSPWITRDEVFWDGIGSRKVWAEVDFKEPTTVHSLTVYENPRFPESWPTESLIQFWDSAEQRWRTAKHGVFLRGPVATYSLDLKRVSKLRYLPWNSYFRNFHTSEIELR